MNIFSTLSKNVVRFESFIYLLKSGEEIYELNISIILSYIFKLPLLRLNKSMRRNCVTNENVGGGEKLSRGEKLFSLKGTWLSGTCLGVKYG